MQILFINKLKTKICLGKYKGIINKRKPSSHQWRQLPEETTVFLTEPQKDLEQEAEEFRLVVVNLEKVLPVP